MRPRIASACCALFLVPLSILAEENLTEDGVVHGTINVALGNKNGLVVLTDSMVTVTSTARAHQLAAPGEKLFKLDDRTVCAVAGFASAPAFSPQAALPDLNTSTSAIIHEYIRQSARQPRQSIAEKLRVLAVLFRMHLEMIANVRDALGNATAISNYRFQLIVAGYDTDDKPKIGRITLRTANVNGSLMSNVDEAATIQNVQEQLLWMLNGMPDKAEQILQHPEAEANDPVLGLYATSLRENGGRSLTVEQMVELAKRLAYYTHEVHSEVGGPNQVAVFQNSQTLRIEQPNFPEPPRPLFRFSLVVNSHFSYSSVVFAKGVPFIFVRCSFAGMQHDLDGHYYIGSDFTDSVLTYDGGGASLGKTNQVTNSVLLIGPNAILEDRTLSDLIATFPWSGIGYAVPKAKPWQVVPSDSSE